MTMTKERIILQIIYYKHTKINTFLRVRHHKTLLFTFVGCGLHFWKAISRLSKFVIFFCKK